MSVKEKYGTCIVVLHFICLIVFLGWAVLLLCLSIRLARQPRGRFEARYKYAFDIVTYAVSLFRVTKN